MNCREFCEFIMGYLDGDLPAEVSEPFAAHLSRCPTCDCYLRQYKATITAGRRCCSEAKADTELPASVPEELIRAILEARRNAR